MLVTRYETPIAERQWGSRLGRRSSAIMGLMNSRLILFPALALSIAATALHVIALKHHFYYFFWWFDMVNHFLVGSALALLVLFYSTRAYPKDKPTLWGMVKVALPFVLAFAVVWEIFEFSNGLTYAVGKNYVFDTALDIAFGLIGGGVGSYYVYRLFSRTESEGAGIHRKTLGNEIDNNTSHE